MKVHDVSMFTPTYCNSHITQSESSSLLIPLAIHTVSVFPNHSQVFAGGLISWCASGDIRALSSSSYSNSALGLLIGPSHSTVSLCPLTPGSRSHLTPLATSHPVLPLAERVRWWRKRDARILSAVWCVSGEVWIPADSCTEGPAAARGRGSHRPSTTTSSPRR